jgi:hypothetical protein
LGAVVVTVSRDWALADGAASVHVLVTALAKIRCFIFMTMLLAG